MLARLFAGGIVGGVVWWLSRRLCPPAERLQINTPLSGAWISSPISVSGIGQAVQHNQLGLRVRDQGGAEIGTGSAAVAGPLGARGPFNGTVSYTVTGGSQPGRVEVYDTSPRDGGLIHLASVEVTLT
jgi:hypothetical protein